MRKLTPVLLLKGATYKKGGGRNDWVWREEESIYLNGHYAQDAVQSVCIHFTAFFHPHNVAMGYVLPLTFYFYGN